MICTRKALSYLAAAALLLVLLPAQVHGAGAAGLADEPLYYVFEAGALGYPADGFSARFEYRSGERVLATDDLLLSFGDADTLLVPMPSSLWLLSLEDKLSDLEVLVFADDLLLNAFDRESLRGYSRVIGYTFAEEIRATVPGTKLGSVPGDKIWCQSPCGGGCTPSGDYDCDGVNNANDNCTDDYNPNQADCDNDGYGDVCDGSNGIFQASGSVDTCMTDKDHHVVYITFEHHVEQRLVDVSSCNSPDRWNRWVRMDNDCYNFSDYDCCYGLRTSISAVGDSPTLWCGSGRRNIDFCH